MQADPSVFEQTLTLELSALQPEAAQMLTNDLSFKGLLEIADQCLYASKRNGRNRYTMSLQGASPKAH